MKKFRTSNNTVMVDILFILLMVFLYVSGTAVPWMNPISDRGQVTPPVLMIVEMSWSDDSSSDIDLWVKAPVNQKIGYANKDIGYASLERDDLGKNSDSYIINGEVITVKRNYEVITFTALPEGEYVVNGHFYGGKDRSTLKIKFKVTLLSPFKEVYSGEILIAYFKEATFVSFLIDQNGNVYDINNEVFIPVRIYGGGNAG